MLQMARNGNNGSVTINELAEMEALTPAYVAKLMRILRKAGYVESTRGQNGGYLLAKPATMINIGEVLDALGGRLHDEAYCKRFSGNMRICVHSSDCTVKSLLQGLDLLLDRVLSNCKLSDLVQPRSHIESWVRNYIDDESLKVETVSNCRSDPE
jgi:Rrf2 family protein